MVCLKGTTINNLMKMNLPGDTWIYFVDITEDNNIPKLYEHYLNVACKMLNISPMLINSKTRMANACEARHMIWCAMRFNDGISTVKIGRLAKRNHATILVNTNHFKERMEVDKKLREKYEEYCKLINEDKYEQEETQG